MEVNLTLILTRSQTLLDDVDRKEKSILSRGSNFNKMLRKEVWYANDQLLVGPIWYLEGTMGI